MAIVSLKKKPEYLRGRPFNIKWILILILNINFIYEVKDLTIYVYFVC